MANTNKIFEVTISPTSNNSPSNCSDSIFLIEEENEDENQSFKSKLIVKHLPTSTLSISDFFSLHIPSTQTQIEDVFITLTSASIFIFNRVIRL